MSVLIDHLKFLRTSTASGFEDHRMEHADIRHILHELIDDVIELVKDIEEREDQR